MRIQAFAASFVSVLALSLTAGTAWAAEPAWELAPSDAKFLLGVNIRAVRNSSLADSLTEQMRTQMQTEMKTPLAMMHIPGVELLDDIESVFVASTGDMATPARATGGKVDSTAAPAAAKKNPAFLLTIAGTFPDEHLRPLLTGPHPSYKGINVYRGTGDTSISFAVLDEHTVSAGDEKSIYRAIDRKTAGAKAVGPLFARARELAATNDFWMLVQDASGNLQKATGPGAAFASEIQGVDMGLALRDGFKLNFNVATKTPATAQMFSQLLLVQMKSALAQKMDAQKAEEFWSKVKVDADGPRMRVQIALTKEELAANIKMMQEQQQLAKQKNGDAASRFATRKPTEGAPSAALATTTPAMPTPSPAVAAVQPAAPPKPRIIKIYGLDDGVREVSLDRR